MKFILGKKFEMSQVFKDDGTVVPVTLVSAEPVTVTKIKTEEKDGYFAIQVGVGKARNLTKAQKGQTKDLGEFKYLREFVCYEEDIKNYKKGQKIDISIFEPGDKVKVGGLAKGKGFTGVVKRWGFKGGPASHGHKDQARMPGSIGACSYPGRVFKGKKMGGRVGQRKVTVINIEVIEINKEKNILALKGAVPGPKKGLLLICQ